MAKVLLGNRQKEVSAASAAPHRWALSFWARSYRRLARPWILSRHVRRFCSPLTVEGAEHFSELRGPAVIIANHTSHFDTVLALSLLPGSLYDRTAVAAAADRFYTDWLKGASYSLKYNAYPIARGGGSAALAYSEWLLQTGHSLLIFPEGSRSRSGDLLPFHPGPAILSLRQRAPVLPIYIDGANRILPPGTQWSQPATIQVRIGMPLIFGDDEDVATANGKMEEAMRALAGKAVEQTATVST